MLGENINAIFCEKGSMGLRLAREPDLVYAASEVGCLLLPFGLGCIIFLFTFIIYQAQMTKRYIFITNEALNIEFVKPKFYDLRIFQCYLPTKFRNILQYLSLINPQSASTLQITPTSLQHFNNQHSYQQDSRSNLGGGAHTPKLSLIRHFNIDHNLALKHQATQSQKSLLKNMVCGSSSLDYRTANMNQTSLSIAGKSAILRNHLRLGSSPLKAEQVLLQLSPSRGEMSQQNGLLLAEQSIGYFSAQSQTPAIISPKGEQITCLQLNDHCKVKTKPFSPVTRSQVVQNEVDKNSIAIKVAGSKSVLVQNPDIEKPRLQKQIKDKVSRAIRREASQLNQSRKFKGTAFGTPTIVSPKNAQLNSPCTRNLPLHKRSFAQTTIKKPTTPIHAGGSFSFLGRVKSTSPMNRTTSNLKVFANKSQSVLDDTQRSLIQKSQHLLDSMKKQKINNFRNKTVCVARKEPHSLSHPALAVQRKITEEIPDDSLDDECEDKRFHTNQSNYLGKNKRSIGSSTFKDYLIIDTKLPSALDLHPSRQDRQIITHASFVDSKMKGCLQSRNQQSSVLQARQQREDTIKRESRIEMNDGVRDKAKSFLDGATERDTQPLRQNLFICIFGIGIDGVVSFSRPPNL